MKRLLSTFLVLLASVSAAFGQSPEDLLKQLKDPEPRVRRSAAEKLGRKRVEAAIPVLGELLQDKDKDVQVKAADALARLGSKSVPVLVTALKSPDEAHRLIAIGVLVELGADASEAVPALIVALKDSAIDVRIHAAYLLGEIGPKAKAALPALMDASKDLGNLGAVIRRTLPSGVCETAIRSALAIEPTCGETIAKVAIPELIKGLKSDNEGDRQAAAFALHKLGLLAKPALSDLEEAVKRNDKFAVNAMKSTIQKIKGEGESYQIVYDTKKPVDLRIKAIEHLYRSSESREKLEPLLLKLLKDPEPRIKAKAAEYVSYERIKSKAIIAALIDLFEETLPEPDPRFKGPPPTGFEFCSKVARLGKDAAPALVEVMKDRKKSAQSRLCAAKALSLLGVRARCVSADLEAGIKDPLLAVAIECATGYLLTGGQVAKAKPILIEGLKHKNVAIVALTLEEIERIGTPAKEFIPELIALLHHNNSEIHILTCRAITKMGTAAKPAIPAIATLLKVTQWRETSLIVNALGQLSPEVPEVLPILVDHMLDEMSTPNQELAAIAKMGPVAKDAIPALLRILKKKDEIFKEEAMETLASIGVEPSELIPFALGKLSDKSKYSRCRAAKSLGLLGKGAKSTIPKLREALEDPDESVRVWAAFALAKITGDYKENVEFMIEFWEMPKKSSSMDFNSPNHDIAKALLMLGAEARPARDLALRGMKHSGTSIGTHKILGQVLGGLHEDAEIIVPKLLEILTERGDSRDFESRTQRAQLIETIGMFGAKAKQAAPKLQTLLDDDDEEIANTAQIALRKIAEENPKK